MDYNYPNKGKVTVHCIPKSGSTSVALLDPWACAGYPSSLWDPFTGDTSIISPLLLVVQLWEYTAVVLCGAVLGETALKHVCFTGVWEEGPLVRLSSTLLCSNCWPHRCSCCNTQKQRQCICLEIPRSTLLLNLHSLSGRKDEPLGIISSQISASIPSVWCCGYARCVRVQYLNNCLPPLLRVRKGCSCWEWCWFLNKLGLEAATLLLSSISLLYSTPPNFPYCFHVLAADLCQQLFFSYETVCSFTLFLLITHPFI